MVISKRIKSYVESLHKVSQRFYNAFSDKLCRLVEYRLYVNNEFKVKVFSVSKDVFICIKDGRSSVIHLDQYPQQTIERWMKEHLCNEDDDHVMIYKKRYRLFK